MTNKMSGGCLALLVSLVLAGCGGGDSGGSSTSSTSSSVGTSTSSASSSVSSSVSSASSVAAVPAAPTAVSATTTSTAQIDIAWASVAGATGYNVYAATSAGVAVSPTNKINGTTIPFTQLAFSNTGLVANTAYYYVVTALNAAGESLGSTEVSATTSAALPATPAGVTASAAGATQINVLWPSVASATGYNLYRAPASLVFTKITPTPIAALAYADSGLSALSTYYYKVAAVNTAGEGAASAEVSATTAALGSLAWQNTGGTRQSVVYDHVVYENSKFFTTRFPGVVSASTDGVAWTSASTGANETIKDIVHGNGRYVAIGVVVAGGGNLTGVMHSSADGVTWLAVTLPVSTTGRNINCITFANGKFTAIVAGGGTADFITSTDGINWTAVTVNNFFPDGAAIAYGNGVYVVYGGSVQTSTDGINWTLRVNTTGFSPNRMEFLNGSFVVVADTGRILTSTDGITWTTRTSGTTRNLSDVTYGNGLYVVSGSLNTLTVMATILTSPDLVTWTVNELSLVAPTQNLYGVAFGNNRFIAAGSLGVIVTAQ